MPSIDLDLNVVDSAADFKHIPNETKLLYFQDAQGHAPSDINPTQPEYGRNPWHFWQIHRNDCHCRLDASDCKLMTVSKIPQRACASASTATVGSLENGRLLSISCADEPAERRHACTSGFAIVSNLEDEKL